MPHRRAAAPDATPLTDTQVFTLLSGISQHPPSVRPELALEALSVTSASLAPWCYPGGMHAHAPTPLVALA